MFMSPTAVAMNTMHVTSLPHATSATTAAVTTTTADTPAGAPLFIPLTTGSGSDEREEDVTPPPPPAALHHNHFITPDLNGYHANATTSPMSFYDSSDYAGDVNFDNLPFYMNNEIPWVHRNKRYKGIIGLHDEICDYYHWAKGNESEHIMRCQVVDRVYRVLKSFFPDAVIQIFGSFSTGLYLPTSDIDLVVLGKLNAVSENDLIQAFYNQGVARDILNLKTAQVPILKITDKKTSLKVDVSFNTQYGVKCAEFIKDHLDKYPCLAPLVLIIKHMLSLRKLNEVYTGGLSSYSIVLMVISFLQTHPRIEPSSLAALNLGVLLIEFFELYGNEFNYHACSVDLLAEGRYACKDKVAQSIRNLAGHANYEPSYLLIRDPVDPKNDVSKGSHKAFQVREAFEYACNALTYHTLPCNTNICFSQSILSSVIRMPYNQVKFRDWVSHSHAHSTLHLDTTSSSNSGCSFCDDQVNLPTYPPLVNATFNKSYAANNSGSGGGGRSYKPKYKCKAKGALGGLGGALGSHMNGKITYVKKLKAAVVASSGRDDVGSDSNMNADGDDDRETATSEQQ